ncbi:hypothetical protein QAD02_013670 [Eretmocerus hayati]|uniref:Uncharacterized protein n=2 Tax=Eretmocerus hayati TaxID=131215 RepID=A0ACC2P7X1_9HYME|nr:hypothetical protein QAD02_013667 [Eretmocerus hayati]KAJ8677883.1 hypothetical protein QAD02_013670 [Eretmocerus hayati]
MGTKCPIKVETIVNEDQISEYIYFGIGENLKTIINASLHLDKKVELIFNVDGLSVFKSSNIQFWPILGKVYTEQDIDKPFVVGIWSEKSKPLMNIPLWDEFIEDLNSLCHTGLVIDRTRYDIKLKCFVCDNPARSLLKCTRGHGGYSACVRCYDEGIRAGQRVVYPNVEAKLRTDESFRIQDDEEHHNSISPFLRINDMNMVTHFILDYMHLLCNGVMYELLSENWIWGRREIRILRSQFRELNRRIDCIKNIYIPAEFQRKSRSCLSVRKWKATELRFFLLYSGVLLMKDLLEKTFMSTFAYSMWLQGFY